MKANKMNWTELSYIITAPNANAQNIIPNATLIPSDSLEQEPITRSLQLPHIPVTAFSQNDLFLVWIYVKFRSPQEPSVTNCNHKYGPMLTCRHDVDMFTWGRIVYPYQEPITVLTEACSCRLELAYFAGKISKNRLVCKNAVALAYYGSCRLLVIGSSFCVV